MKWMNFAGKFVPESAVMEMKSNFKLPEDNDPLFDSIEYVELQKRDVQAVIERLTLYYRYAMMYITFIKRY